MRKQFWQNLIVGIFVAAVLAYGAYFIYNTSEESTMLLSKITLTTTMKNANGLKKYSPIRVHGISIGKVETVRFSDQPGEDLIYITMSVNSDYLGRIAIGNPDPEAAPNDPDGAFAYFYISSEGLLGDNLLDIYAGDPKRAGKAAQFAVRARAIREIKKNYEDTGAPFDEFAARPEIDQRYQELIKDVKNLSEGYVADNMYLRAKPGGGGLAAITESLDPTLKRVNDLLDAAKTQPGLVHTLIYDPKGKELMSNLNKTADQVQGLLSDVRQGPGGLHDVIYGEQLGAILTDLSHVSGKVNSALSDVKGVTGKLNSSMDNVKAMIADLQAVVGDVKEKDIVGNVKGTVANVEEITRKIKDGEGSLGLLITDKSLYEDLQELLGGAKRSTLIREALRYVRSRNKENPEDRVVPDKADAAKPPAKKDEATKPADPAPSAPPPLNR